jgi:glyoxalase family protein
MLKPGAIRGTHHLTFCVGGAQEDYDFHVRLLGLRSVKKTVLFDGEIPIYHLYYANRLGDLSTILTAFPYRQAGWMGKRGTNQLRTINLAVPVDSLGYWADRLAGAGLEHEATERLGTQRLDFAHPCGIPYSFVGETEPDDRRPW